MRQEFDSVCQDYTDSVYCASWVSQEMRSTSCLYFECPVSNMQVAGFRMSRVHDRYRYESLSPSRYYYRGGNP